MASVTVRSEVAGIVARLAAAAGSRVAEGDEIIVLEAMKMELPVPAPVAGRITAVLVREGDTVAEGQAIATLSRE